MARKRIPPDVALWPKLSRFYGLSFDQLRAMPHWAIDLYVADMEIIHASEQLDRLEAASFPYMEEADHRQTGEQYRRVLRRGRSATAAPAQQKQNVQPGALAALGIGVVREGKSA